ncbi:NAD(P)-dependent oxidoreductase [Bosea sp. (in: a-proteobacteria)]|uniref:precorrin-2 dehydrogenase/sirohydrochlorin ferrochelatase family protein n=1 Tax=Bosea sp. (in: a-proteobacteria) TaxID=1871050 RepID=UPI0025BD4A58|nr:NAD(P)-dependent oxidoreductase [Bosea sp. (in: a-proteobacteria)]
MPLLKAADDDRAPGASRAPLLIPEADVDRLAKLPIFLDLAGRRAVVVGGGVGATWKVELLAAAGAKVEVFAHDPAPALSELAQAQPSSVTLRGERWEGADFTGVVIALLEPEHGDGEITAFRAKAKAAGAVVNVIDTPHACDFQFGTIVNRSPTIIGISTDGAAPILAQALRRRIEAMLPPGLAAWTAAAKAFRDELAARLPGKPARRRFWERFVDLLFAHDRQEEAGSAEALRRIADAVAAGDPAMAGPHLTVLTVDPLDPERLTLRDIRLMQGADLILHAADIAPAILDLARREARRMPLPADEAEFIAGLDPETPLAIVKLAAAPADARPASSGGRTRR